MAFLQRYWKTLAAAGLVLVVVNLASAPILKLFLRRAILQQMEKLESRSGQRITYRDISFPAFSEILVTGFRIAEKGDSSRNTFHMDSVKMSIFPLGFISGNYLRTLEVDSISVQIHREKDSTNNYGDVLRAITSTPSMSDGDGKENESPNLNERMARYLDRRMPTILIRSLNIRFDDRLLDNKIVLDNFGVRVEQLPNNDTQFELAGRVEQGRDSRAVGVSGVFHHADRRLQMNGMFDTDFRVPFLSEWLDLDVTLGSFDLDVLSLDVTSGRQNLQADVHISQLGIFSEAISGKRMSNLDVRLRTNVDICGDSVSIHSAEFTINQLRVEFSGSVASVFVKPRADVHVRMPMIQAHDFLLSLPEAFSSRIRSAQVDGSFEFSFDAHVDWAKPDSVRFDPDVKFSPDFKVRSLGDSISIKALRDTFTYSFARGKEGDTSFVVGPSNPWFLLYDSIPQTLVQAVVLSEDGSFFRNEGFNVLQIEKSIAHNIKSGKFARGASTISMQFSKNLFLSREKTLSRKFQEILITWLMNHESLLDPMRKKDRHKKRLMEIYLNIIEWGPDVYGIGSAAGFYFAKRPRELTVSECVFLATIIPNPKKYDRYFDHGISKKSHVNYMNLIKKLLYRHEVLSADSLALANAEVIRISGPAAALIEGYPSPTGDSDLDLEYEHSLLNTIKP